MEAHPKQPEPARTGFCYLKMGALSLLLLLPALSPPHSHFGLLLAVFIVVPVGPSAGKKDGPLFPTGCQSLCWPDFDLVTLIVGVVRQTPHLFVLNKKSWR